MSLTIMHSRDVAQAWKTAAKNARWRRLRDRIETCRSIELAAEHHDNRRLARLAGKLEACAR